MKEKSAHKRVHQFEMKEKKGILSGQCDIY